nr:MAG TPA: PD-(D/E)XK nuclease superfamily protein [Bacteriophage sp.]
MDNPINDHSARAHALLSASSSHRWLNCPPSAVAAEAYANEGTEFTREGTLAHEVAELVARERQAGRYPTIVNYIWPEGTTAEMVEHAHGYADYIQEQIKTDGATVLLEQRVDFSTWVPDGFGTADCIIVQDKTITVIDYKYGQGVAVDAKENTQMMLYALGALNLLGDLFDIETVDMHIYQPRINNVSTWSAAASDLLYWADKTVKRIAADAAKGKGKYKAGAWCKFCPHAGRCRQLTKTCTEYVETHSLRVPVPVLAPHEVAEVLEMEPLISLWLKRVKAQAMDTLLSGGEVPGFKVVEGKLGNRKWTDELKVAEALAAAGYGAEDYTETKLLSPAAMDKSLGKKKVAELLEALIDRAPGAPTIVPASDKRPPLDRVAEAIKDFE